MKMDPFIEAEEVAGHSVKRCCELFEVSRSAYYQRKQPVPTPKQLSDGQLLERIRQIHDESDGTYGSPRVHNELAARGVVCGRRRVRRRPRASSDAPNRSRPDTMNRRSASPCSSPTAPPRTRRLPPESRA